MDASFRSMSPKADAHIRAMPKPVNASYDHRTWVDETLQGKGEEHKITSPFKSKQDRDAYVKECTLKNLAYEVKGQNLSERVTKSPSPSFSSKVQRFGSSKTLTSDLVYDPRGQSMAEKSLSPRAGTPSQPRIAPRNRSKTPELTPSKSQRVATPPVTQPERPVVVESRPPPPAPVERLESPQPVQPFTAKSQERPKSQERTTPRTPTSSARRDEGALFVKGMSEGTRGGTASFKSTTSKADAHIKALGKKSDQLGGPSAFANNGFTSSVFKSGTSTADAHVKALQKQISGYQYGSPSNGALTPRGGASASFRSKSPSDRDSHIRALASHTYSSTGRQSEGNAAATSPTANFRSASPIADAHIRALGNPTNASYEVTNRWGSSPNTTASYRSQTSIADAHIRSSPRMHDGHAPLPQGSPLGGASASFRSTTSIGDAHIRAVPKPIDTYLTYKS